MFLIIGFVKLLLISRIGKEYCVLIILFLCINGGVEVVVGLVKELVFMFSIYLFVIDGSSYVSKKVFILINML